MEYYNLVGDIAPEIGDLARLEELIVPGNAFGTLPSELSKLHSLRKLHVRPASLHRHAVLSRASSRRVAATPPRRWTTLASRRCRNWAR